MIIKESIQKNSLPFFAIFLLFFFIFWIASDILPVQGAGLTFSASTTVSLTGTSDTLTIISGSTASSVAVGTSTIVVAVAEGDTFTLRVNNKSLEAPSTTSNTLITNDPCYSNLDSLGKLSVIGGSGGGSATIRTAACTTKGSGGEISQSAGLSVVLPPSTPVAPAIPITAVPATPTSTTPAPSLPPSPTAVDIQPALDILVQQVKLILDNPTAPNIPTLIEQVRKRLVQIQQVLGTSGTISPTSLATLRGPYTTALSVGSTGDDVAALQNFLKAQGNAIYPEGEITGYFGPLTKKAVGNFQTKYGILTSADDPGYGFVGPKTRAKINELLGL